MKNGKVIIRTIITLILITIAITMYILAGAKLNTMKVAFYDLPNNVETLLINWLDERNINWEPVLLDSQIPANKQIQGPVEENLLFIQDGANLDTIAPLARTAKSSNLMTLPVSLRTSVKTKNRLTATPILMDHYQMAYNNEKLAELGAMPPTNLVSLEAICDAYIENGDKGSFSSPLTCAGSSDSDLSKFFSSLIETVTGVDNYTISQSFLTNSIDKDGNINTSLLEDFFNLPQVYQTLEYILDLENNRYLSSNWLNITSDNIKNALENSSPLFAFMPFSSFQNSSEKTKEAYEIWYMPSGKNRESRYLIADIVTIMEFSYVKSPLQSARQASVKNELAASLITEFGSSFTQSKISNQAKLCPVNATAQIENRQTAETRELLSLANGVIGDISSSTFTTNEQKSLFANALRQKIEAMRENKNVF